MQTYGATILSQGVRIMSLKVEICQNKQRLLNPCLSYICGNYVNTGRGKYRKK